MVKMKFSYNNLVKVPNNKYIEVMVMIMNVKLVITHNYLHSII